MQQYKGFLRDSLQCHSTPISKFKFMVASLSIGDNLVSKSVKLPPFPTFASVALAMPIEEAEKEKTG